MQEKEVVQLYYEAPYTQFDIDNSIEKSTVNLIDYQKTDILQPGESQTLSFTLEKEDMASYCYTHHNENGTTGCYVLENGEYTVSVRANSHEIYDTRTFSVEDTFWYDGSDEDHIRQSEKEGQSQWDAEGNPTERRKIRIPGSLQRQISSSMPISI